MKKLLVTGASGFLGWNLCREARKNWEVFGTVFSHPVEIPGVITERIDLTDFQELKRIFHAISPDAVIHTAAASNPDYCQNNKEESKRINVDSTVALAGLCTEKRVPFVFTSTDLVFDGFHAPYREEDPVSPVNQYGEQKAAAEEKVLKTSPSAVVCRMPLMFGDPGPAASSFFITMKDALNAGSELKLFADEFRTPVSGETASRGLLLLHCQAQGLLHLGGNERISRYEFGLFMMKILGLKKSKIRRCLQQDIAMSAPRAPDVSLDSAKAFALGFTPPSLHDELVRLLL